MGCNKRDAQSTLRRHIHTNFSELFFMDKNEGQPPFEKKQEKKNAVEGERLVW